MSTTFPSAVVMSANDSFYDAAHDLDDLNASWVEDEVSRRIEEHIARHLASMCIDGGYKDLYAQAYRCDYHGWVKALRARQQALADGPGCEIIALSSARSARAASAASV